MLLVGWIDVPRQFPRPLHPPQPPHADLPRGYIYWDFIGYNFTYSHLLANEAQQQDVTLYLKVTYHGFLSFKSHKVLREFKAAQPSLAKPPPPQA